MTRNKRKTGSLPPDPPDQAPDDLALFRAAVADVTPLPRVPRSESRPPAPAPIPVQRLRDEAAVIAELLEEPELIAGLETGEELLFLRPGYQKRWLTRLRRGHYAIQDELDLHHLTVDAARRLLLEFISEAVAAGHGCVRVIHGKGLRSRQGPRLKQMTDHALRRHPAVVAFASCKPVDGGTGAVAVLLKSR